MFNEPLLERPVRRLPSLLLAGLVLAQAAAPLGAMQRRTAGASGPHGGTSGTEPGGPRPRKVSPLETLVQAMELDAPPESAPQPPGPAGPGPAGRVPLGKKVLPPVPLFPAAAGSAAPPPAVSPRGQGPILAVTEDGTILRTREQLEARDSLARAMFPPRARLEGFTFRASLARADLRRTLCAKAVFVDLDLLTTDLDQMICPGARFPGCTLKETDRPWLEAQGCDLTGATFKAAKAGPGAPAPGPLKRRPWSFRAKEYQMHLEDQAKARPGVPVRPPTTGAGNPEERALANWRQNHYQADQTARLEPWQWEVLAELLPELEQDLARKAKRPSAPGTAAASRPSFSDLRAQVGQACRARWPNPWQTRGRTPIIGPEGPGCLLALPPLQEGEAGRRLNTLQDGRTSQRDAAGLASFRVLPTQSRYDYLLEIVSRNGGQTSLASVWTRGAFAWPLPFRPEQLGGLAIQTLEDGSRWCALADTGAHTVRRFRLDGGPGEMTWGQPGRAGTGLDAEGRPRFNRPTAVDWGVLRGFGGGRPQLFVADSGNHTVCLLHPDGGMDTWGCPGVAGDQNGGTGTVRFNDPQSLLVWTNGVYVADRGNGRIRFIEASSGEVGNVVVSPGAGEAPAAEGGHRFRDLRAVAAARFGDGTWLLALDGHRLCRIGEGGVLTTLLGVQDRPGNRDLGPDQDPRVACLDHPCALATGRSGDRVYIAQENGVVRVYDTLNRTLGTVAGQPGPRDGAAGFRPGLLGDGAPDPDGTTGATLGGLRHLAVDPDGGLCLTLPGTLVAISVPERPVTGPTLMATGSPTVRVGVPLAVTVQVPAQAWPEWQPEAKAWAAGPVEYRPVNLVVRCCRADGTPAGDRIVVVGRQGEAFTVHCQFQQTGEGWVQATWITDQGVMGGARCRVEVHGPEGAQGPAPMALEDDGKPPAAVPIWAGGS